MRHHEVLPQTVGGGGEHFPEPSPVEDGGLLLHPHHAGLHRGGRPALAQGDRGQPEAASALAGRGRVHAQPLRADLPAQGLQGHGQDGAVAVEYRRGRGLLGIGVLTEFGQRDGRCLSIWRRREFICPAQAGEAQQQAQDQQIQQYRVQTMVVH